LLNGRSQGVEVVIADYKAKLAQPQTTILLDAFLKQVGIPEVTQVFKSQGYSDDDHFEQILNWTDPSRVGWLYGLQAGGRITPFQFQVVKLAFERWAL
jgi:hypothetical protein